jgi:hypothetical protein
LLESGDAKQQACTCGVPNAWNGVAERRIKFVQSNNIQADTALPALPSMPTLPPQSSGKGTNDFASSLRTAEKNSAEAALARAQADPTTAAGRAKLAEKAVVKNSKTPALEQAIPAIGSTPIADAKAISVPAANPETTPAAAGITISFAAQGSMPPAAGNSRLDTASASDAGWTRQTSPALAASPVQQETSTHTVFDSGLAVAELNAGEQTSVAGPPPKEEAVFGGARVSRNEGDMVAHAAAPSGEAESTRMQPVDAAGSEAHARTSTLPRAALAGLVGVDAHGLLGPTTPTEIPRAEDLKRDSANVASGVNKSASDSKPQTSTGDLRTSPAPSTTEMPRPAIDAVTSTRSFAERINPSALDSYSQPANRSKHESRDGLASASGVSSTPVARGPANQEHAASNPPDSSPNPPDASVPAAPPSVALSAMAGRPSAGEQPGSALATANVLAQVSPVANQDSGSRIVGVPAAERPSPTANLPTPLPTAGVVETARLVAGASQSEMHIGLRTQAFGSVEVHTVVRDSQVGLTVGSERGDLRALLATEFSGLQTAFRQQDLRFDNIRFLETSASTTAGFSGGADSQARSSSHQHSSPRASFSSDSAREDPELAIGAGLPARLNVHA